MDDKSYRSVKMPKKKTGQRKKHDKMKARQKEIGLRGERKDHLNIAERYHLCYSRRCHWKQKLDDALIYAIMVIIVYFNPFVT